MLNTHIIPCFDVADGRVVKGVNFVDLIDAGNSVVSARTDDGVGATELCFLAITTPLENRGTTYNLVALRDTGVIARAIPGRALYGGALDPAALLKALE